MERLHDMTIVVTGAGGAFAILVDIDADALAAAQAEIGPASCATFACDIRDAVAVTAAVKEIKDRYPDGVRALVNNAGVFTNDAIEATRPDRAMLAFEVNVHDDERHERRPGAGAARSGGRADHLHQLLGRRSAGHEHGRQRAGPTQRPRVRSPATPRRSRAPARARRSG